MKMKKKRVSKNHPLFFYILDKRYYYEVLQFNRDDQK